MTAKPADIAASVRDRLRNIARQKDTDYQLVLRRYAAERLLHRLGVSAYRDQFILKGAMLFTAWLGDPFRPTQDLDLLGCGDPETTSVGAVFAEICRTDVGDDGLVFAADGLSAEPIRAGGPYGGVRVRTRALLGTTRIPVQADIGFGDAIMPAPQEMEFPPLLAANGPHVKAYPKEAVVAEKLEAIVAIGRPNTRMKDFYDLFALARLFPFDGETLTAALRATFDRRGTTMPANRPVGLSPAFAEDPEKTRQWSAFVGRQSLQTDVPSLAVLVDEIAAFVMPPAQAASSGTTFDRHWPAGGGWMP